MWYYDTIYITNCFCFLFFGEAENAALDLSLALPYKLPKIAVPLGPPSFLASSGPKQATRNARLVSGSNERV
ncbi:hypothetical protein EKH55_0964 [Sinorhizobium alkalisoli]|nr:hypothetical protein EKH55_0964 [Sinorhizobium alkalisoli]